MALWDSVTNFFKDLGDFFNGKSFFEMSGYVWEELMNLGNEILVKNPTTGDYEDTWTHVSNIYTTLNTVAVTLMVLFFVYSFCKESVDLHTDLTMDRSIKLFIRLIIVTNVMSLALEWMPKFIKWAKVLTEAILGEAKFGFSFDGAEIYKAVADSSGWGALVAFLTSFLFFLFTCVCGFMVIFTILNRVIKIYMIAPFAGIALSTLAGGGQIAQVGYSYIKSFFCYVLSALLIAVVIVISTTFIDTISFESDSAIVTLVGYCIKMGAIATAVKSSDSVMQKAFGL
ncbi:MAG: hypothetical protein K6G11_09000 [Lachnospiraceae bacterium]|nr:hypothetical protein [Lachnospiraceae bacterium]